MSSKKTGIFSKKFRSGKGEKKDKEEDNNKNKPRRSKSTEEGENNAAAGADETTPVKSNTSSRRGREEGRGRGRQADNNNNDGDDTDNKDGGSKNVFQRVRERSRSRSRSRKEKDGLSDATRKDMLVAVTSCRSDGYYNQKAPGTISKLPRKAPTNLKLFHELAVGVKDAYAAVGETPTKPTENASDNNMSREELDARTALWEFIGNLDFVSKSGLFCCEISFVGLCCCRCCCDYRSIIPV